MRHPGCLLALTLVLACADDRATSRRILPPYPGSEASVLKATELAGVRCLIVAPFENGSDAPLVAETATAALISEIDSHRARVLPLSELRGLFRDTPLELPAGFGPSLALELGELVGADAVLYGSVEGQSREAPELVITIRLSLTNGRRLLFARTIVVRPAAGERIDSSVKRAVLFAARPVLARLGDDSSKKCFESDRTKELRKLALAVPAEGLATRLAAAAQSPSARAAAEPPSPPPAPVPVVKTVVAPAPRVVPRTPRQMEWAQHLEARERFVLDEVSFDGRSTDLQRDAGLADLAVALSARPEVSIRLEGFVDLTSDRPGDQRLSAAMAQVAAERLVDLGVARNRLSWIGRGGESPRLPNFTARGRAANRRIEVSLDR